MSDTNTQSFASIIKQHALCRPSSIAVRYGNYSQTYEQLNHVIQALAVSWSSKGIVQGSRIAILARKNIATVQAMVTSLGMGSCHIPIDWRNPPERLGIILNDCRPEILVGSKADIDKLRSTGHLPDGIDLVSFEDMASDIEQNLVNDELNILSRVPASDSPAYCLYTSGSTGDPKGVLISYGAFYHFCRSMNEWLEIDNESSCLNTSPFFFDVSVADTLLPLVKGATVHLTGDIFSPPAVIELIKSERITNFCAVSSLISLIANELNDTDSLPTLKTIMSGAEILRPEAIQTIFKVAPQINIINGYGPTESTCVCLARMFSLNDYNKGFKEFPIGIPLLGLSAELILNDGTVLDGVAEGELVVSGPQLMLGYLDDIEITNAKIIYLNGIRYYRTGDNCRRDEDNEYYFQGRIDDEVKISGYRFHLNEVLSSLHSCDLISDAAVLTINTATGKNLSAVLVSQDKNESEVTKQVEAHLRKKLPSYMIPTDWKFVTTLPRTSAGKIDKKSLTTEMSR